MSSTIRPFLRAGALLAALLLPLGALPGAAEAVPHELGSVLLRDGKDRDVVRLPACRDSSNRLVRELRLVVSRYPAEIDRLRVEFQNGGTQELLVRERFDAGTVSRWIDLRGPRRCIARIVILGDSDTIGWRPGRRARVTFLGR